MERKSWWRRLGLPWKVGLICAALGLILALVGIIRGAVPLNPLSVFLALLISAGSWGIVSWAVTTAVVDVEDAPEGATAAGPEPAAGGQPAGGARSGEGDA